MSPRTSTTAQAILQSLEQTGPATAEHLRSSVRRRQGLIDKALSDLANEGRVVAVRWEEDAEDQPHWQLTETAGEPSPDSNLDPENPNQEVVSGADEAERPIVSADDSEAGDTSGGIEGEGLMDPSPPAADTAVLTRPASEDIAPMAELRETEDFRSNDDVVAVVADEPGELHAAEAGDPAISSEAQEDLVGEPREPVEDANTEAPPATEPKPNDPPEPVDVKACRGCQEQMPKVCPCCWRKTPSFCGNCRKQGSGQQSSSSTEILSNGLPKLRRGELLNMVDEVMRKHPLPEFNQVAGWTSNRIAVHLPGRSTGAIGEALARLSATGKATLLNENPRRYAPVAPSAAESVDGEAATDISPA